MLDQANNLRQLVRDAAHADASREPRAQTFVASGARPGGGTTTLVAALARELTLLGKRVALVDANVAKPALAARFSLRTRRTLADVLTGARSAAESFVRTDEGIVLLAGVEADESLSLGGAACERLAGEISIISRQVQIVLIDAGAGMNPWVDRLWRLGAPILVVDPDPAAILDAYAMLKQSQYHRLDRRVRLAVNRADAPNVDLAVLEERFAETCRRFLCIEPRRAVHLAERVRPGGVGGDAVESRDDAYARSVRLLAADLACELRTPREIDAPRLRSSPRSQPVTALAR